MSRPYEGSKLKEGQSEALHGLYKAITDAEDTSPGSVPCVGPERHLWTSPHGFDQAKAAQHCQRCPVLTQCAQYANTFKESGAVWGGQRRGYVQQEISIDPANSGTQMEGINR